jgi:hypothetical protein
MFMACGPLFSFEAPQERNRLCLPRRNFCSRVSLLTERDLSGRARSYKHLAPLERKLIQMRSTVLQAEFSANAEKVAPT